ncbi:hypothetical protein Cni_G04659 [Canna indica]|uniref:Uncharacterized protein n=1 Tax=Canna indica TaxID=4628 RepID=A0AAQ3JTU9_9LILI|nr:hypothetical protein Cni_G04659 [Canna indica]
MASRKQRKHLASHLRRAKKSEKSSREGGATEGEAAKPTSTVGWHDGGVQTTWAKDRRADIQPPDEGLGVEAKETLREERVAGAQEEGGRGAEEDAKGRER